MACCSAGIAGNAFSVLCIAQPLEQTRGRHGEAQLHENREGRHQRGKPPLWFSLQAFLEQLLFLPLQETEGRVGSQPVGPGERFWLSCARHRASHPGRCEGHGWLSGTRLFQYQGLKLILRFFFLPSLFKPEFQVFVYVYVHVL